MGESTERADALYLFQGYLKQTYGPELNLRAHHGVPDAGSEECYKQVLWNIDGKLFGTRRILYGQVKEKSRLVESGKVIAHSA